MFTIKKDYQGKNVAKANILIKDARHLSVDISKDNNGNLRAYCTGVKIEGNWVSWTMYDDYSKSIQLMPCSRVTVKALDNAIKVFVEQHQNKIITELKEFYNINN